MMKEKKLVPKRRFKGSEGEWNTYNLGEKVEFFSGLTYSPNDAVLNDGTLVIRSSNIKNNQIIDADNVYVNKQIVNSEQVRVGDIIVVVRNGSRDLIGKNAVVREEMTDTVIGAFMTGIRSKYYNFNNALLNTNLFKRQVAQNLGATINQITIGMFNKMVFNFPNKEEQQKIGEFFKVLDERIANKERKIAKVKALKSAYLTEMFPQEGETVPKRRFKEFTEEWNYCLLKEVINSEFKGRAKAEMLGGNSPYLDTDHLNGGEVSYVNLPKDVEKDDVLILWDGSQAGMVYHGFEGALGSTLKAYKPKYSGEYLYQFLKKNQKVIFEQYRTPNIPHVINTFVDEFWICIPSIEEQQKIGQFFKNLDDQIRTEEKKLEKLKKMKEAYLEEMFV
ncbi:restriction endonuclease subunit S [Globicatella sulfidifaciens]|uniref:Restriction endonuclease subunit S n=1 Tax=Globicatella sulfidifaciens TaxID=136093 RepID=A0A7X8C607_9LACT|nr:restriction endonuclease subunit S [Globicatella sulfidifaciens]NLJ19305.1 restriction endonuclease subunit S [Globicatella sulfidifaciens]